MQETSSHAIPARSTSRRLPEACDCCGEWITYYRDIDGIWAECDCSAGYLS